MGRARTRGTTSGDPGITFNMKWLSAYVTHSSPCGTARMAGAKPWESEHLNDFSTQVGPIRTRPRKDAAKIGSQP